jgi:predicted O-linked N-acetylglucosamine transferase (SPINDLY family)
LLKTVGLPSLIAKDWNAYRDQAIALGRDPEALRRFRQDLLSTGRASPLFDTARQARYLEAAYHAMWRRYRSGGDPAPITIPG